MYRIRGVNFLHEEMNSISNMLSFKSSMNVICTCCVGEICMNKILFKPTLIPFQIFSGNLVQIYSAIRRCAENKNHNYVYSLMELFHIENFSLEIMSAHKL